MIAVLNLLNIIVCDNLTRIKIGLIEGLPTRITHASRTQPRRVSGAPEIFTAASV